MQAFLSADPLAYLWLKDSAYKEVASKLNGPYRDMTCCILGLRGTLVREEPLVARALTQALLMRRWSLRRTPRRRRNRPYAPKVASLADLEGMVRCHTHHHHPVGEVLEGELKPMRTI